MYDTKIKGLLDEQDIHSSVYNKRYIIKILKELGEKENKEYIQLICDGDFLLLKFICHRGCFRDDIFKKCVLCKKEDNNIKP